MGFSEKASGYQPCLKFLEAISPKSTTKDKEETIDLTSPTESPDKDDKILCIEMKTTGKVAEADDTTHEKHETQDDDNNNNEETKEKENSKDN